MSSTKHTPEPWKVGRTDLRSYLGDGQPVHYVYRSENEGADTRVRFLQNPDSGVDPTDDALRVVSCVNAMQGIADPAAFRKCFDKCVEALTAIEQHHAGKNDAIGRP